MSMTVTNKKKKISSEKLIHLVLSVRSLKLLISKTNENKRKI